MKPILGLGLMETQSLCRFIRDVSFIFFGNMLVTFSYFQRHERVPNKLAKVVLLAGQ